MCKKCKSAARLGYAINNCGREWQKIHAPVRTHHCEHGEPHRRERTAEAGGRSAEPRCRWAALEIGSRARCWAPEQPLLPSTAEPRRSAAVKRTRAPMCTQPIRGCGRLLAHAPRLASVAAGWAGLQRRRRGGGAAPLWAPGRARPRGGRARCRWCALPAGAAPPPSSPPALLGRRGAGRRRSGGSSRAASVASMSSSRAKKVKMATKSCPECDQQVRRGVVRRGAGAALSCPVPSCPVPSCQPSHAWRPAALPSVPVYSALAAAWLARQPCRWGCGWERGEPRVCGASMPLRCPRPRASACSAAAARAGASRWAPPLFLFSVSSSRLWLFLDVRAVEYVFVTVTPEAAGWAAWFSERRKICTVYSSVCMKHGVVAFAVTGCVYRASLAVIVSLCQRILWHAALLRHWYCLVTTKYIKIQLTL